MNKPLILKRTLQILAGLVLVLVLIFSLAVFFRQRLLDYAVKEVQAKVAAKYPAQLLIGKAVFTDLNSVSMQKIALVPNDADTLLVTREVMAEVSFASLMRGKVNFNELTVSDAYLTAIKDLNGTNNYSFLITKDKTPEPVDTTKSRNYGALLNNLIETAFESVPEKVSFNNLNVSYHSENRDIDIKMPALTIDEGEIKTSLRIKTDSLVNNMRVHGSIDPDKYFISGRLFALDSGGIVLPYVKQKFGGTVAFDTLSVSLSDKDFSGGKLTVRGNAGVTGLTVNHPRIADEDIEVKSGAVKYVVSIAPDYFAVDTLTEVRVNKMKFYPVVQLRTKPAKDLTLRLRSAVTPANDFFASLPKGMFETLEGIKADGGLSYKLNFHVNMADIAHLKFDSDLEGHNLKILDYGKGELNKMNRTFTHTVFEYGRPVRTFDVGPGNGFFAPYHTISPYLKNVIMTSEDAGFFRHKGFHEEAFRQSIVTNIKNKKFARGGSTISMQLVKNVFLTRKKTIARKVEEALIVWLIENNRITSKTRMYEVYLNIIEWGPNVYGIKDASRFFYGKQPSELTLAESIFLAHIIPKPKAYKSAFNAQGNLKPHVAWYFRLISGIMRRRGLISEEEYAALTPHVALYGRARDLIVTAPDTAAVGDTLQMAPIDLMD